MIRNIFISLLFVFSSFFYAPEYLHSAQTPIGNTNSSISGVQEQKLIAQELEGLLLNNKEIVEQVESINDNFYVTEKHNPQINSIVSVVDVVQASENIQKTHIEEQLFKHPGLLFMAIETGLKTHKNENLVYLKEAHAPRLHAMVQEICTQLNVQKPFVFFSTTSGNRQPISTAAITKNISFLVIPKCLIKTNDTNLKHALTKALSTIQSKNIFKQIVGNTITQAKNNKPLLPLIAGSIALTALKPTWAKYIITSMLLSCGLSYTRNKSLQLYKANLLRVCRYYENKADDNALALADPNSFISFMQKAEQTIIEVFISEKKEYFFLANYITRIKQKFPHIANYLKQKTDTLFAHLLWEEKSTLEGLAEHPAIKDRIEKAQNFIKKNPFYQSKTNEQQKIISKEYESLGKNTFFQNNDTNTLITETQKTSLLDKILLSPSIYSFIIKFYEGQMHSPLNNIKQKNMPKLHTIVDTLCKKMNMAKPALFMYNNWAPIPNAYCSSLSEHVTFIFISESMIKNCSDAEIESLLAHELDHIKRKVYQKNLLLTVAPLFALIAAYGASWYISPNIAQRITLGGLANLGAKLAVSKIA